MINGGKAGFNKPVLIDHDLSSEPLGRVVYAEFTQLKTGQDWLSDWKNPEEGPGKMGSGYITTTSHIFNPEAMVMIADGRYSTVSTRQEAKDAWCSVCGTQFEDGCEHEIESVYDGVPCYAVTGLLDYIEQSFVNSPRQPNAKVMSFKQMKDALMDKDVNGTVLVGDCRYEGAVDSWTALKSLEDLGITINLADTTLPSIGTVTGKTQVSMTNKKKEVILDGFDKAKAEAEAQPDTIIEDNFYFIFANLCRFWKDSLDLKEPLTDSSYVMGITDKSSGHAHVFDSFLDTKNKVFRGNTYGSGQGKTTESHGHAIWLEGIDLNQEIKGETRSASAGPDHTHTFVATMCDAKKLHGTLISDVDTIQKAIKALDDRVNKDTLQSGDKDRLLDGKNTKIVWDDVHFTAAMRLMGRLSLTKRQEVVEDLIATGFLKTDEEEPNMEKSTVDKLLVDLLADKTKLTAQLADAIQLADSKEAERQKLLDENVGLKTSILNTKATLIVNARVKLSGEPLEDAARKTTIQELATKDETTLDTMLDTEVIANIRKEYVAPVVETVVADNSKKELITGESAPPFNDSDNSKTGAVTPPSPPKSFASLDKRITQKATRQRA
jgi:hypothetical protein